MHHKLKLFALMLPFSLAISACGEGSEPTGRPIVTPSALERDGYSPTVLVDPGTGAPKEEVEQFEPLFESFEKNATQLFQRDERGKRLETIERAYIAAGRYLDIVAIYRAEVKARGLARGPAGVRLTWAMVRLGQDDEAKRLLADLIAARPKDPDAWFLLGAFWIKFASGSKDAARKVTLGWSKTIELSPKYLGFEGINAATLERELERLSKQHTFTSEELSLLEATMISRDKAPEKAPAVAPSPDEATPGSDTTPPAQNEPVAEVPEEVAPDTPPENNTTAAIDAPPSTTPTETTPPAPTKPAKPEVEPLTVMLGRAQIALSQGERAVAQDFVRRAILAHAPDGKFEAIATGSTPARQVLTLIRTAWESDHDLNAAARTFRALATRKDLDARITYEMAMFAWKKLEDVPLARELFERFARLDPERAKAIKIERVLEQLGAND